MSWLAHTLYQISVSEPVYDPWPHLVVDKVFSWNYYAALLANRAADGLAVLNPSIPQRRLAYLRPVPELFWGEFAAMILGPEIQQALVDKFALPAKGSKTDCQLIWDTPGYALGPHTDIPEKLITGLFYLPQDDRTASDATRLFISKSGRESDGRKGFPFEPDFEERKAIGFCANRALFFPRTDWSFHAVRKTDNERWLVSYDIYR